MRCFKLEHKRQRKYRAALFMFIVLLTSLVYFNYGRPTGFVIVEVQDGIIYSALKNEQVLLFTSYHPEYSVIFRELDHLELQLAKERKPHVYGSLEGRHYEAELFDENARIIAIIDENYKVIKVYNPNIE